MKYYSIWARWNWDVFHHLPKKIPLSAPSPENLRSNQGSCHLRKSAWRLAPASHCPQKGCDYGAKMWVNAQLIHCHMFLSFSTTFHLTSFVLSLFTLSPTFIFHLHHHKPLRQPYSLFMHQLDFYVGLSIFYCTYPPHDNLPCTFSRFLITSLYSLFYLLYFFIS